MDYEGILNQIIALRDDVYENLDNDQVFKIKPQLDQIRELADSIYDEEDTRKIIDRISVYEFLMDMYARCGRLRLSNESCRMCIELSRKIMDQDSRVYEPVRDYYRTYIANRYLLDGEESQDLENELYEYLDQEGLDLKEMTLEYFRTAPKPDPVEDSEEYLNVIDEVNEKLYNALEESVEDEDYPQRYREMKKQILRDDYGIEWNPPKEYSEED